MIDAVLRIDLKAPRVLTHCFCFRQFLFGDDPVNSRATRG
jgi:hypothetical protein